LIVQQNYFSDLYPAKILDLLAKPFFVHANIRMPVKFHAICFRSHW